MHCIQATCQVALRAAAVSALDRLNVFMELKETVCTIHKNNNFRIISATMTHGVAPFMCRISLYFVSLNFKQEKP
jgi:hypothetical protein